MSTPNSDLNAAVAALWARQRGEMMRRVEVIERALAALAGDALAAGARAEAQREAHNIAGAAGSFGFATASARAREIELALRAGATAADAPGLFDCLSAIRSDFDRPRAG